MLLYEKATTVYIAINDCQAKQDTALMEEAVMYIPLSMVDTTILH
jgi:hypothetical protein